MRVVLFLIATMATMGCAGRSIVGDIPDVRAQGIANQGPPVGAQSLCDAVSPFDSIVEGIITRVEVPARPWVVFTGTTASEYEIRDTCELAVRENLGLEIEVAVESVLHGEDPGRRVVARLGTDAGNLLIPRPNEVDGKLGWDGVGARRDDGDHDDVDVYGEPLVVGQSVGLTLTRVNDPNAPVTWTVARGWFFMEKGGLVVSRFDGSTQLRDIDGYADLAERIAHCASGEHDDALDAAPLETFAGACYTPTP